MTSLHAPTRLLGGLSPQAFMRRVWQRRPWLVRQAWPGVRPPIPQAELFALAGREGVESRLVVRDAIGAAAGGRRKAAAGKSESASNAAATDRWQVRHGPFTRRMLPPLARPGWTLLVQGLDLHVGAAHAMLAPFRFVPAARLDDLMISWASPGGGVGPHMDSYDVFLLQVQGRRRWRVAPPPPSAVSGSPDSDAFVPGLPVKILREFEPVHDWVLEPGDMLYLPPGWAHDGIAEGPCMTCSIGFRAPSRHEFLSAFLADAAESPAGPDPRFGDAGRRPTSRPAQVPEDLRAQLARWARGWRPGPAMLDDFIGRFLTEPKPQVWFERAPSINAARFAARAARIGLRLDRRTRIAYRRRQLFVNGERFEAAGAAWLRALADRRRLDPASAARALAEPRCAALLLEWHEAGWLHLSEF